MVHRFPLFLVEIRHLVAVPDWQRHDDSLRLKLRIVDEVEEEVAEEHVGSHGRHVFVKEMDSVSDEGLC